MNSPEPESPLSGILRFWQVRPKPDRGFPRRVLRRITAQQRMATWPDYLRRHVLTAGGALLVALALGAWGGHEWSQHDTRQQRERMVRSYVASLDARVMARER